MNDKNHSGRNRLKDAFQMYDDIYLENKPPTQEDISYSKAYLKSINQIKKQLGNPKKHGHSVLSKQWGRILAASCILFICSVTVLAVREPLTAFVVNLYQTETDVSSTETIETLPTDSTPISETNINETEITVGTPPSAWVNTELYEKGWKYTEIDLSSCQYQSNVIFDHESDFIASAAKRYGYQEGTYEYDFFRAMLGISYYTSVAEYRISERSLLNDPEIVNTFFENYADPAIFQEPYDNILYESFTLLRETDFRLHEVTSYEEIYGKYTLQREIDGKFVIDQDAYWADYQYHIVEWSSRLALLFSDIDEKLIEYAEMLLILPKKYPNYHQELKLSETAKKAAEHLIEACKPISESRDNMFRIWGSYYLSRKPNVTVKQELIPEKGMLKLSFISENNQFIFDYHSFQSITIDREFFPFSKPNDTFPLGSYASPAILYIPIQIYYRLNHTIDIVIYDEYQNTFDFTYPLSFRFEDFENTEYEPVRMDDPFLDAVLKKEFGDEYTYFDLCKIKKIFCNYYDLENTGPKIQIEFYDQAYGSINGKSNYFYSDFFEIDYELQPPEEFKNDIKKFPCLSSVKIYGKNTYIYMNFVLLN